jgi:PIN domain nuclease of toxin-antitoxin system
MSDRPGNEQPEAVLLDTCAVIWLANGEPLVAEAVAAIVHAGLHDGVFVSPISAWEIGMLSKARRGHAGVVRFMPDPRTWFARFMAGPGIRDAPFNPDIAIASSWLPGEVHGDPVDRLIIATARHLSLSIVTRDRKIIAYAEAGEVAAILC